MLIEIIVLFVSRFHFTTNTSVITLTGLVNVMKLVFLLVVGMLCGSVKLLLQNRIWTKLVPNTNLQASYIKMKQS